MKHTPTVFIVDDDVNLRKFLVTLAKSVQLPSESFESAQGFLDSYQADRPGVLILDIRMPGMSGLELQQQLIEQDISLPVIMITGFGSISTAVQAMKLGAVDYLEKPLEMQKTLDAIHAGLRRDQSHRERSAHRADVEAKLSQLTPGEHAVLAGMAAGKGYKTIAEDLGLSYKTVEARRAKIMKKMNADGIADLLHQVIVVMRPDGTVNWPSRGD